MGEFVNGNYHGYGRLNDPVTDRTYEGNFNNNVLTAGKIHLPDGSVYDGKIQKWKMHGQGIQTLKNGNIYVGTWDNDVKHGLLTQFKPQENIKQREQFHRGVLKDTIRTPCDPRELEQHIKNPGYGKTQEQARKSVYRSSNVAA